MNIESLLSNKNLNEQQRQIAESTENMLVIACPGSGKTRVLTYKLAYTSLMHPSSRKKIIAITYTNRAADEIKNRLELFDIEQSCIWTGTIHQFCLEFILCPYSMFLPRLSKGFRIIDEYVQEKYVRECCEEIGKKMPFGRIQKFLKENESIFNLYQRKLEQNKEIDFELILKLSHDILHKHPNAANLISRTIRSIYVDEYQDTNALQYKIIGQLTKSNKSLNVMFVGDPDQAIFGNLGGVAKDKCEIENVTELKFTQFTLDGCYRSSQRLIDYYSHFQRTPYKITSCSNLAGENGIISLMRDVHKDNIHVAISNIIQQRLEDGIQPKDMCVIAPQWYLLYSIGKKLMECLPHIKFDSPNIMPFKVDDLSIFYKFARLIFTEPGKKLWLRKKIANEIISTLTGMYGLNIPEKIDDFYLLDMINGIVPESNEGIKHYECVVSSVLKSLVINDSSSSTIFLSLDDFLKKSTERISNHGLPTDIGSFYKSFAERNGLVVTTHYGIKGEEYNTVISFGMLHGYLPHWETIYAKKGESFISSETNKMLYVIASRAKERLYLIAEKGRQTQTGKNYELTDKLKRESYGYRYDTLNTTQTTY